MRANLHKIAKLVSGTVGIHTQDFLIPFLPLPYPLSVVIANLEAQIHQDIRHNPIPTHS